MIVCDFEGTIYNEAKLRSDFRRVFASFGLDFETIYRKCAKHGHFSLESLDQTSLKKDIKIEITKKCRELLCNGSTYIFSDAKIFLQKHAGEVSVLTFGSREFQKEKVLGSGIAKYIEQVEITQLHKRESKDLLLKARDYIDNDPAVIVEIAEAYKKIKCYLIDRDGKYDAISGKFIKIKNLTEVDDGESRGVKTKKQKNRSTI
jgi:hypothetical protein